MAIVRRQRETIAICHHFVPKVSGRYLLIVTAFISVDVPWASDPGMAVSDVFGTNRSLYVF